MIGTLAQKRRTAALATVFILAMAATVGALLAGGPARPAQAQSGGINLTATSLSVDENNEYWQYFQLSLASAPDGYVGINVEVDEQTNARFVVGVTNSYGQFVDCEEGETCYIHINDDEWDDQQVVYVNALIDDNRSGGSGKIKITTDSGDPDYDGLTGEVSLTEYDTVGAAMLFPDGRPSYISEGGNASFSVQLAVEPYHDVTVTVSSSDPDITVAQGASLTFTASNYSSKQWVRLDAKEDDIALTAQSTIAVKSESDDNDYDLSGSFTITEIENDTARFVLRDHQSSLTVPEGGSREYYVKLNSQPSADVTVTVSSNGDSDITVSPATLVFRSGDYSEEQTITVGAADDDGEYINETATITHGVSGASEYAALSIGNINVTARDNDAAIFVDTDPSADGDQNTLALAEGGSSATYTVRLSNRPSADVTVSISETQNPSTGNVKVTSSKSLTFTSNTWNTPQNVTVRAYNDQDAVNGTPTINHDASGGGFDNAPQARVDVTERDAAAAIKFTDARMSSKEITLGSLPNGSGGVWSDGTTIWVNKWYGNKLYAYTLATKARDSSKDINATAELGGNGLAVASDGAAIWWSVNEQTSLYAYKMNPGQSDHGDRDSAKDITLDSANAKAEGLWTDGTTMWVADDADTYVYAYTLSTGNRDTGKEFDLHADNAGPAGLWGDSSTIWVTDHDDEKAYAYTKSGGVRDPVKDYDILTASGNDAPFGIWSDGTTIWVTDLSANKLYAYSADGATGNAITSLDVPEGGATAYYVSLGAQPASDVTVTLSASGDDSITVPMTLTFTAGNYSDTQAVTVSAAADGDLVNGSATIQHNATGGGYDGAPVKTLNAREVDKTGGITVSTNNVNVPEGSSATYTVVLTHQPTGGVTVRLALQSTSDGGDSHISRSPSTLYFNTSNWNQTQTVTVRASQDSDAERGTRAISHTASGGGYNVTAPVVVTATELDDEAAPVLTDANDNPITKLSVADGGPVTYKVALSTAPAAGVTVTVRVASSGDLSFDSMPQPLSFTSQNWNQAQTVTVTAGSDDDALNDSATITHTGDNGYGVTELAVTETDATPGVVISGDGVTGSDNNYGINVSEGGSATYKVRLKSPPTGNVTVRLALQPTSGDNPGDPNISRSPSTLYFNTNNWEQDKPVTVRATQDSDKVSGTRTITHTASGGGYNSATEVVVTARELDDEAGLVFTAGGSSVTALDVPEGGTATYAVALSSQPTADVTVAIAGGAGTGDDTDVTVKDTDDGTAGDQTTDITFTSQNWETARTVTLAAGEDDDPDNGTRKITHTVTSTPNGDPNYDGQSVHLTAHEADNDHDIIIRNAADTADISTIAVTEGSSTTYKVKLAVKPTGNVTVTITEETTGDTDLRLTSGQASSTKTLYFNAGNYNRAQTVRVHAIQDDKDSLDGRRKLLHTASGGGYDITTPVELLATEQDNDKQLFIHDGNYNGITTLFVPEGGTARYVIELRQNPSGPVTVNLRALTGGDPDIDYDTDLNTNGAQKDAVTLSAGNLRATVEVSAASDEDESAGSKTIRHTPTGIGFNSGDAISLTVTEIDQNLSPTLTAGTPTATTVPLTIANYPDDRAWWYQHTAPTVGTCTSVAAGVETVNVTGLTQATTYTFKAYNQSSCNAAAEVAAADEVATMTPTLAVSGILKDAATLVLSGWVAGTDGSWYYKGSATPHAACQSSAVTGQAVSLTQLAVDKPYTYTAYSDSGCNHEIATSAQFRTLVTEAATLTISNLGQTATTCTPFDPECGSFAIGAGSSWVTFFSTGAKPSILTSVTAKFAAQQLHPGNVVARIYSSSIGAGTVAATLTGPVSPSNDEYTYTCSGIGCALDANTRYGLAFEAPSGPANGYYRWQRTASYAEDTGGATGWSISNGSNKKEFDQWTGGADTVNSGMFKVTAALDPALFAPGVARSSRNYTVDTADDETWGIWSDGTTIWVNDYTGDKLYANKLSDGTRVIAKDITSTDLSPVTEVVSITGHGSTIWASSYGEKKLYAYNHVTKARDTSKDITLNFTNTSDEYYIWTDGVTMWVGDIVDDKVFVFALDGARDTTREFNLDGSTTGLGGLWSDGTTMWASNYIDGEVYAYRLSDGSRLTGKGYDSAPDSVGGIWSDGKTIWMLAYDNDVRAYYAHPPTKRLTATGVTATGATLNIHWHTDAWWYARTSPTGDTTCTSVASGTTTATLGSLTTGTAYTYQAYSASGCNSANEIASVTFTTP